MGSTSYFLPLSLFTATDRGHKEFKRMADAIADLAKSSGKPPLIYNLCEWGWVSTVEPIWSYSAEFLLRSLESSMALGKRTGSIVAYSKRLSLHHTPILTVWRLTTLIKHGRQLLIRSTCAFQISTRAISRETHQMLYSNSFITMATDFYGQNDMDYLCRSSMIPHTLY